MNKRKIAGLGAALFLGTVALVGRMAQTTFKTTVAPTERNSSPDFSSPISRPFAARWQGGDLAKRLAAIGVELIRKRVTLKMTKAGLITPACRQTAGNDMRADMKRAETISFRPFAILPTAPELACKNDVVVEHLTGISGHARV